MPGNNRLLYPLSSAKVDIFFHPSTITSAFNHGSLLKESKQVSEEELTQTTDRPEQKREISKVRSISPLHLGSWLPFRPEVAF